MNKLLISHRGNLRGPNPDYENNPEHIVKNVLPNFDCEVDLRFDSHNNTFYLGRDFNQYEIDFSWLENFSKKLLRKGLPSTSSTKKSGFQLLGGQF